MVDTLFAALAGGAVAVMVQWNGMLQAAVGPLAALTLVHASGLATAVLYLAAKRFGARLGARRSAKGSGGSERATLPIHASHREDRAPASIAPLWFAIAGILGVGVVFLSNAVFDRGRVVLALSGAVAGQVTTAFFLERTHWLGGRRSPLLQGAVSVGLVLPGTVMIGAFSGVAPIWIFIAFTPGVVLMFQSMMNSRNALRWGIQRMLVINYLAALLVLVPAGLVAGSFRALVPSMSSLSPAVVLGGGALGVIAIGVSSFLLNRASAVRVVLGMFGGQMVAGILLDSLAGVPFEPAKILGVIFVVVGLAAGELRRRPVALPLDKPD